MDSNPQVQSIYKPYTKGIPTSVFVMYVAQKEKKSGKAEIERIGSEIRHRYPKFIIVDHGGITLDKNQIMFGGEFLDLSEDGYALVEGHFIKYLHRFRFWSDMWISPINLLITLGVGVALTAIVKYLLIPFVSFVIHIHFH